MVSPKDNSSKCSRSSSRASSVRTTSILTNPQISHSLPFPPDCYCIRHRACVEACKNLKITPLPTITVIVVGKRHHVRFFPTRSDEGDRSGNCRAGTVVDRDITHPVELDFYLQSHAGLLGTSRPAHYNVLYDDNGFSPDSLQALSFALCHVYARSTRSVSIPAPVYCERHCFHTLQPANKIIFVQSVIDADIVCSRAKNHYNPDARMDFSGEQETKEGDEATSQLQHFKTQFKQLHQNMKFVMYFS